MDELNRFIHDLRNPIGALSGFCHLIQTQRASLTSEQFEAVIEGINRTASRLTALVDDFADKREI